MPRTAFHPGSRLPPFMTALWGGLFTAQVISTLHVYLSNIDLYRQTLLIADAGFLTVPAGGAISRLTEFGAACGGGLFFTLTIGVMLTLAAFGYAWVWERFFQRRKSVTATGLALWTVLLVAVNAGGLVIFPTAYVLFIPPVVFGLAVKRISAGSRKEIGTYMYAPLAALLVLSGTWAFHIDREVFIDFRDYLLLSNSLGRCVNDFYYDYTLYPARTFKPLEQKLLKTARVINLTDERLLFQAGKQLLKEDYIPLEHAANVDLTLEQDKDRLVFKRNGKAVLSAGVTDFLSNPGKWLKIYSQETDTHVFFRIMTLSALLAGLPAGILAFSYSLVYFGFTWFLSEKKASIAASVLCLITGLSFLVLFYDLRKGPYEKEDISRLIRSQKTNERIAGLRLVHKEKLEIADYPADIQRLKGSTIPERYWLAMALSVSRNPSTLLNLKQMLHDPQPNVACKAVYALGRRGGRSMIPVMLKVIASSSHWYVQTYAYHAAKDLGWKQAKSGSIR